VYKRRFKERYVTVLLLDFYNMVLNAT